MCVEIFLDITLPVVMWDLDRPKTARSLEAQQPRNQVYRKRKALEHQRTLRHLLLADDLILNGNSNDYRARAFIGARPRYAMVTDGLTYHFQAYAYGGPKLLCNFHAWLSQTRYAVSFVSVTCSQKQTAILILIERIPTLMATTTPCLASLN